MNEQREPTGNYNFDKALRILIIEDVARDADLAIRELKRYGIMCEVSVVCSRKEMLGKLEEFVPDVIISDYSMPQFTGMEALEIRNERIPDVPFIIVTASINEEIAVECIKRGADDYVTKEHLIGLPLAVKSSIDKKRLEIAEHQAREQIKLAAHEWRTTFDAMRETVALLDIDRNILRCNAALMKLVGKPWKQIIGHSCCKVVHGYNDPPAECPALRASRSHRRETWQTSIGDRWFDITADPIVDEDGRLTGIVHIITDITDRKHVEAELKQYRDHLQELVEERTRELREAQEKLVRQEKLAVIGELAGGVSHELRNPIGAIKNAVYFLKMESENFSQEMLESLEIIESEVSNATRIITTLLDFARPTPPTFTKIDINEFFRKTVSHLKIPESLTISYELSDLPSIIRADEVHLERILENIVNNAIQAMPDDGTLTVRTSVENDQWVTIAITDNGIGIPPDQLDKLFEPLFTTKAKGIGLGLSIVKNLIERHNGRIDITSEEKKGTTVRLKFPVDKNEQ